MMKNPPHPGKSIWSADLEPLGITTEQAARHLGVGCRELTDIMDGKAGISPEMSIRLYKAFGGGLASWRRLQASYDLAQIANSKRGAGIRVKRLGEPLGELGLPVNSPLHPGLILLHECLERMEMSVAEAADHLGVSYAELDDLVNCRADLTPEMAIRLDQAFGGHAQRWYGLQANHDVAKVALERAHRIKVRRLWRQDPETHEPILLGQPDNNPIPGTGAEG